MEVRSGNRFKGTTFIGQVVDNADPLKLERIRVRVPDIFDGVPDERLPWALPHVLHPLGHGAGAHSCHVPVVNSLVYIRFDDGDPHFPQYCGSPVTPGGLDPVFATNYPNRYGYVDPQGNVLYTDMVAGDVKFKHHSGTTLHIKQDGSVVVECVAKLTLHSQNDMLLQSDTHIQLTAPRIDLN